MANRSFSLKPSILLTYAPSFLILFGWIEFQVQLLVTNGTKSTWGISPAFILCFTLGAIVRHRKNFVNVCKTLVLEIKDSPNLFKFALLAQFLLFILSSLQAIYPPHLGQEYDAVNYLMALPRQHLLSGTWGHLPWSVADLWPATSAWGFAPTWFLGDGINKVPQWLVSVSGFGLLVAWGRAAMGPGFRAWIPALILFGTQGVTIQLGTAMLDTTNLYLLIAFGYSLQQRIGWLAGLHLAIYVTSKSFHLGQVGILFFIYLCLHGKQLFANWRGYSNLFPPKFLPALFLFSCIFFARPAYLSTMTTGTPLYPFFPCLVSSIPACQKEETRKPLLENANYFLSVRSLYGEGRGPIAFLKHLWTISVPTKKLRVNNAFDYPLGMGWLLFVVLFFWSALFHRSEINKMLFLICLGTWLLWWMGSQQSRWLYATMLFGLMTAVPLLKSAQPKAIWALLFAINLSGYSALASMYRGYRQNFSASIEQVQLENKVKAKYDHNTKSINSRFFLYADGPIEKIDTEFRSDWILPNFESNKVSD